MKLSILDIRTIFGMSFLGMAIFFLAGSDSLEARQASTSKVESGNSAKSALKYDVDLSDAKNHYLTINLTIPVTGETTELMMAVWTPGSYLVREYARNIDSMEVSAKSSPLKFEKTRKNRWLVQTAGLKSIQVKYRLYCNEMSVRTNWVGKQYAMINGAPTFITVPDRLDHPHIVRLKMPRGWTRSATSLRSTGETPHTFVAKDFDELVDSPIVAGNVSVYPFTVGGIEHQLVNIGESGYWDGTKAATDLKRIVKAHHEIWGVVPYDRYLFLNMIVESGGGLEHDNSSMLMTSRWTFRESGRYRGWLSLASHEFFHAWNVRRLRPKSLVQYDYENEVYTESLWIAEGITSYYQELAVLRAGLMTRNEFISSLSRTVEGVQRTRGRKLQSLRDSSFDAWIKYYRPDENSSNTTISYYSKGAVVAFLLDAKIRKLTKGEKSLDDVMRMMFAEYEESGFTPEDFRKTASLVAGKDLTEWFASVIDSTDELNFDDIEAIGVMVPNKKPQPKPVVEKKADDKPAKPKPDSAKSESTKEKEAKEGAKQGTDKKTPPPESQESDSKRGKSKKTADRNSGVDGKKLPKKKRDRNKKSVDAKSETNEKSENSESKAPAKGDEKPEGSTEAKQSPFAKFADRVSRLSGARSSSFSFRGSASRSTGPSRPWLGFSSSSSDGKVIVSGVKPDSPAADVGLNNGDEIIAVEGYRITRSVDSRLSQYKVGDEIDVLIARRGKLMTLTMTIGQLASESWRLRFVTRPSKEQQRQLDLWLGGGKE